ncbi:hypothetical protein D3C71_1375790 [compost metagenome]
MRRPGSVASQVSITRSPSPRVPCSRTRTRASLPSVRRPSALAAALLSTVCAAPVSTTAMASTAGAPSWTGMKPNRCMLASRTGTALGTQPGPAGIRPGGCSSTRWPAMSKVVSKRSVTSLPRMPSMRRPSLPNRLRSVCMVAASNDNVPTCQRVLRVRRSTALLSVAPSTSTPAASGSSSPSRRAVAWSITVAPAALSMTKCSGSTRSPNCTATVGWPPCIHIGISWVAGAACAGRVARQARQARASRGVMRMGGLRSGRSVQPLAVSA